MLSFDYTNFDILQTNEYISKLVKNKRMIVLFVIKEIRSSVV